MTTTSTPSARGLHERLDAGRAAIDRDQKRGTARGERAHRLDIRAVALEQAVGNMDQRLEPAVAQKTRQQRSRGSAIDVVVAEDGDRLAAPDRVRNACCRLRHGGEHVGVGHQPLDRRIEKRLDRVDLDVAAGENAGEQFGQDRAAARSPAPAPTRARRAGRARRVRSPNARRQGKGRRSPRTRVIRSPMARD